MPSLLSYPSPQTTSPTLHHPLMVPTPHPSGVAPNHLLATSKLIHSRHPVLTTLPRPAPILVLLHSLPLESRTSSNLHISTRPDAPARLGSVLISIERHRARQVPVAKLGDGADDVDAVAPLGADVDGEGEGDGFGVFAGWGGVGDGDGEGCGCFADAGGVDVPGVHEGVDGAVVGEAGGGVGDVVGVCGGDHLGGGAVADDY